jgi:cytochrome P450
LDQALAKTKMEFMTEVANPLPVRVIAEMLGIPSEDQRDFQIWSDDLADFFGNATAPVEVARRAQNSLVSLTEYFRALLPERRENKGDDLVSLLLRVEEEGEVLTKEELLAHSGTVHITALARHWPTPRQRSHSQPYLTGRRV